MATYNVAMREAKDEAPAGKKEDGYSLQELSDQTGVEQRTIRSYVERGLLPGPDTLGRGAKYPPEALDRLRVMGLLRDANRDLTLDQIRVLLQSLSPAQLADIAAGRQRIAGVIDTDAAPARGRGDALAYLQSLRPRCSAPLGTPPPPPLGAAESSPPRLESAALSADLTAFANAARALADLTGNNPPRAARGEIWYRIPVTPDIELSVRGAFGDEERAHLQRIGDALRQLLTKGTSR